MICHAAGESGPAPAHTNAVVLAAEDEHHLLRVAALLYRHELPYHLIREPDGGWNNQAMAIGLPPMDRNRLNGCLANLKLLKELK